MSRAVAVREKGEVARPLRVLVPLIKDELEAGAAAGLEHYRRAGEMLLEAKEQLAHGEWYSWLNRNFHLGKETARRYMQLAGTSKRSPQSASLSDALGYDQSSAPSRRWHAAVQDIVTNRVNVDKLAEERQSREKEQQLIHQLGQQLIDIGYKVLASKLHPDKGGSAEAMARLNRVRNLLRSAL